MTEDDEADDDHVNASFGFRSASEYAVELILWAWVPAPILRRVGMGFGGLMGKQSAPREAAAVTSVRRPGRVETASDRAVVAPRAQILPRALRQASLRCSLQQEAERLRVA